MTKVMDAESASRNTLLFIFELKFRPIWASRFRALYVSNISLVYIKKRTIPCWNSVAHKNATILVEVENNLCVWYHHWTNSVNLQIFKIIIWHIYTMNSYSDSITNWFQKLPYAVCVLPLREAAEINRNNRLATMRRPPLMQGRGTE